MKKLEGKCLLWLARPEVRGEGSRVIWNRDEAPSGG